MRRIMIVVGPLVALLVVLAWYVSPYLAPGSDTRLQESIPPVDYGLIAGKVKFEPSYSCKDFHSIPGARRALEERYNSVILGCYGSRVISRAPKLAPNGRQIGIRITAIIRCGIEGQQSAIIWWTDGAKFCHIVAPLISQAETLEKTIVQ
jgi:hypothetical protein